MSRTIDSYEDTEGCIMYISCDSGGTVVERYDVSAIYFVTKDSAIMPISKKTFGQFVYPYQIDEKVVYRKKTFSKKLTVKFVTDDNMETANNIVVNHGQMLTKETICGSVEAYDDKYPHDDAWNKIPVNYVVTTDTTFYYKTANAME